MIYHMSNSSKQYVTRALPQRRRWGEKGNENEKEKESREKRAEAFRQQSAAATMAIRLPQELQGLLATAMHPRNKE